LSEALSGPLGDAPAVCIDFKNPKAYLALQPTYALEDQLGIAFDWWPTLVAPMSRPQEARQGEDRGTRHKRIRAQYYERDIRRYASEYGLKMGDLHRNPDATVASIGLLWVKQYARDSLRQYLSAVFDGYWQERLRLDDVAAIEAVLREIGVPVVGWGAYVVDSGRESFDRASAGLREAGVFDVPAYVVEREVFFGRQHLPMVRWLLTGNQGEPPI
jgi:2-hydroxychromene-2-carboxylate isomerase